MRNLINIFFISAITLILTLTSAQAEVYTGKITQMFAAGPGNYALRVYLDSVNSNMCQYAFIYINADDGNYQVYSSLLMSSWVAGKTIEATITKDSQGFCHIVEFYAR